MGTGAEVQAAKIELQAIEARMRNDKARKLQLVAELELEDEVAQEAETHNVNKSVESDGQEEFTFTEIDGEESEGDEDDGKNDHKAQA